MVVELFGSASRAACTGFSLQYSRAAGCRATFQSLTTLYLNTCTLANLDPATCTICQKMSRRLLEGADNASTSKRSRVDGDSTSEASSSCSWLQEGLGEGLHLATTGT